MSWTYYPDLLARPVPRYTSYPTAAEFGEVAPAAMARALANVRVDATVSLYLHIPYCHEICWYCGCNTGAANRTQRVGAYLDALHAEIDLSQFPGLLVQNEKNAGRYRMLATGGNLAAAKGIVRSCEDRRRGEIVESLLCHGEAYAAPYRTPSLLERLAPFEALGLASWDGATLRIPDAGRPYARAIAALFDPYRQSEGRQFSNAI